MTSGEHMTWCKTRALAYVDRGDLVNALASMASDVRKHPETDNEATSVLLGTMGALYVINNDVDGIRRLIEGFAP